MARRGGVIRTPTVLQMEAVECGAAALAIVLAHHGRIVPLSELREACGVSRDGSNAASVVKAARRLGLEARGLATDLEDVQRLAPPFVVFWNFNHFVVVEGFRKDRAFLNDPATGRRAVSLAEFDRGFTGVVLAFEPGPQFVRGGRPPSLRHAIQSRLRGSARDVGSAILAGLLLVAPGLAIPMLTQVFIDGVLIEEQRDWLRPVLWGLALLAVLQGLLRTRQLADLRALRTKLAVRLSGGFVWHVLRLPVGFFAQRFAGEISSRTALNREIADALSGPLATATIDATMVLFYVTIMLFYDAPLTLIGVVLSLGNVVALRFLARRRADANLRLRQEVGKVGGVSIAGLQSIETLKASALESSFFARWAGYYTKAAAARYELGLAQQAAAMWPALLSSLTTLSILMFGGLRVMAGELSIGGLVAFQALMTLFQRPVGTLVALGARLQTLDGDLQRVDDVLLHPPDAATVDDAADADAPRLHGDLELRALTFGYSRAGPPLVEGLDLVVRAGQRVALVGGSGSGKSTVARLICGLYEPWEGQVLLDGAARRELGRRVVARSLGLVDQDIAFFAGSVRDNLALWDSAVSLQELEAACRDAEIHDVILALSGGYDAELLEGAANLSGGQRQRLEIARTLVTRPSILVLDEATSALDAETEFRIDRNLRRRGCTTVVVAHRLSTIRDAEEILVLRGGRVVERGRHEALWERGGEYRRLIESEGEAA